MYKNLQFGNIAGTYNVRQLNTALRRKELGAVFLYSIPGPKMLWQFGELGYDFSIFTCENGTVNPNDTGCKLSPKPIRWDYYQNSQRRRLFDVTAAMIHLKKTYAAFSTTNTVLNIGTGTRKTIHLLHPEMNVAVMGNFNVVQNQILNPFPHTGRWYEYFTGDSIDVANASSPLTFAPGEYRLYTSVRLPAPPSGYLTSNTEIVRDVFNLEVFPNPSPGGFGQLVFNLPKAAELRVDILDITGRNIQKGILQGLIQGGEHWVELPGNLAPGVYLIRLQVENQVEVQKWIVQ